MFGGMATLTGSVTTWQQRETAERAAASAPGITCVENEIRVEPIDAIARRCGFGTVETLRRAFARRLGVSPGAYRDRFAA